MFVNYLISCIMHIISLSNWLKQMKRNWLPTDYIIFIINYYCLNTVATYFFPAPCRTVNSVKLLTPSSAVQHRTVSRRWLLDMRSSPTYRCVHSPPDAVMRQNCVCGQRVSFYCQVVVPPLHITRVEPSVFYVFARY